VHRRGDTFHSIFTGTRHETSWNGGNSVGADDADDAGIRIGHVNHAKEVLRHKTIATRIPPDYGAAQKESRTCTDTQ
jgi:hypothetical protein